MALAALALALLAEAELEPEQPARAKAPNAIEMASKHAKSERETVFIVYSILVVRLIRMRT